MFKRFFNRPSPDAVKHVVNVSGPREIARPLRDASSLRRRPTVHFAVEQAPKRGMWVFYENGGHVGILTDLAPGDIATVMLVDEKGLNVLSIERPASEFRQATVHEIPEPRRPDADTARRLGYLS